MTASIASEILVRGLGEEDRPLLERMYDTFSPMGAALGLPSGDPARRRAWLGQLRNGINLVALVEEQVAGHLVLMPSGRSAEMALFVHQDFRRQGVAAALVHAAVEEAHARGLERLWVLVSSGNFPALIGLRKFGFLAGWEDPGEVQMVLTL